MNQILAIFLPAIFGVYMNEELKKQDMKLKEWLVKYGLFILLINILNFIIVIYFFGKPNFTFTNVFTLKYLLLGTVFAVILAFIVSFVEKNIEINIRIDKNEK